MWDRGRFDFLSDAEWKTREGVAEDPETFPRGGSRALGSQNMTGPDPKLGVAVDTTVRGSTSRSM